MSGGLPPPPVPAARLQASRCPRERRAIRRAEPRDVPAMTAIVEGWLATVPWNRGAPPPGGFAAAFAEALPIREIWVAGDPAEGYLSLDPVAGHIHGFYVARPGHGIGRALLDHVKAGRDRLTLNTHAPNQAAHRFYEREGFHVVERDLPGTDGVPELRMEWRR